MNNIKEIELIAEIAQSHDGSLGILHSYIDSVAESGIKTIKFQTHIAEAESSEHESFRVNFSFEDKTRFDYWKRMEFTFEQWVGIKEHCEKVGLEFMSSPFSLLAFEWLEKLNVKRYKIGSGEISNLLLLNAISKTLKPIILSSGLSDWNELDNAIELIKKQHQNISVLQCATVYPSPPEMWGLNILKEIKNRYQLKTGFSDHSGDIYAPLAAAALGAEIIEFHVVFDKKMFGPDSTSSLNFNQVKQLVEGVNKINIANNNPIEKIITNNQKQLKTMFGKSLAINKNMNNGDVINLTDLESKKPANIGIFAADFEKVLGKKLNKNKNQWDFLNWEDLD